MQRYRRRVNEHARDTAGRDHPQTARDYVLRQEDGEAADRAHGHIGAGTYATAVPENPSEILRLSVSDAVMRMDLADRPVMILNSANNQLNVVYRRNDGHIGWIDPTALGH